MKGINYDQLFQLDSCELNFGEAKEIEREKKIIFSVIVRDFRGA